MLLEKIVSYSVVIPCYNSGTSLRELVMRLGAVFRQMGQDYEIILVNDASPNPSTWPLVKSVAEEHDWVKAVNLTRNFGQQSATLCGMGLANGNYVITMDDDLQHQPEDIPLLIAKKNHDIVIAHLKGRKDPLFNQLTSRIKGYFDYLILGKPKHIRMSSFRLLSRLTVDNILSITTPKPFIPALMFYVTKDVVNVEVTHQPREEGKSNYTFLKRLKLFSLIIINNSSAILNLMGYFGIFCAFLSFVLIIYLFIKKWVDVATPIGWTSTISAILFFGGMTLFSLGLLGEYLIRLMPAVEKRPMYLIREIYESKSTA